MEESAAYATDRELASWLLTAALNMTAARTAVLVLFIPSSMGLCVVSARPLLPGPTRARRAAAGSSQELPDNEDSRLSTLMRTLLLCKLVSKEETSLLRAGVEL
jgi:hypothetical protein